MSLVTLLGYGAVLIGLRARFISEWLPGTRYAFLHEIECSTTVRIMPSEKKQTGVTHPYRSLRPKFFFFFFFFTFLLAARHTPTLVVARRSCR